MATKRKSTKSNTVVEPEDLTEQELEQLSGETETAVAVPESSSPADLMFASDSEITGDTESVRMKLPRLNIVQKVGPLGDKFNKGEIVLNNEDVLIDGTKQGLEVTAVKAIFFYEEWLAYGDDRIPERAKDMSEVVARGGNTDWGSAGGKSIQPSWRQVAEVLFAVKAPKSHLGSPSFPFIFEGETDDAGAYTFALLKLKGSSFNSAGRELVTAKNFYYRGGLNRGSFLMTCPLVAFRTGNSAYVCTLRKHKLHTAEFLSWLGEMHP